MNLTIKESPMKDVKFSKEVQWEIHSSSVYYSKRNGLQDKQFLNNFEHCCSLVSVMQSPCAWRIIIFYTYQSNLSVS